MSDYSSSSDSSSSESIYASDAQQPTHNVFGEPTQAQAPPTESSSSSSSSSGLPQEQPMQTTTPPTESIASTAATTNESVSNAWQNVRAFFANHWHTMMIVLVCVVLIVVIYYIVRTPAVQAWWKSVTTPAPPASGKMVLPRDGDTNVVAKKPKTTFITKEKEPKRKPVPSPRPDPHPISPADKEVFNISNNIYTYEDAPAVCKAYNARLATPEEVHTAFNNGADWCNYGWTQGQVALFPTQKATFNRMHTIEGHEHDCGVVGVNGGYFQNPDLQFGVNCYGKKPEPRIQEKEMIGYFPDITTDKEKRMQERVAEIKKNNGDILITPFNSKQWDANRTFSESVNDWMKSS